MSRENPTRNMLPSKLRSIVALGANLPSSHGPPSRTLDRAVELLEEAGIRVTARSRWFSSPAWPEGSGPDYVNGAIAVEGPDGEALLSLLHQIETILGRTRKAGRWDARVCDLDILCIDGKVLPDETTWRRIAAGPAEGERPGLVLPHPLLHERAFVLVPLADVAPDWRHPVLGATVADMLAALSEDDVADVRPLPG